MKEMVDGVWRLVKRKRPQTYDVSTSPKFRPLQMKKQLRKTKETSELDLNIGEFLCCSWKSEFVFKNWNLLSKIGVCSLKMESVFENRSLFSEIGVWTSEFAFQKSEFAFKKSEAVCLRNRTLKIGVLLKLRPRLCAFFSHVGSTLRRGFRGYMQR